LRDCLQVVPPTGLPQEFLCKPPGLPLNPLAPPARFGETPRCCGAVYVSKPQHMRQHPSASLECMGRRGRRCRPPATPAPCAHAKIRTAPLVLSLLPCLVRRGVRQPEERCVCAEKEEQDRAGRPSRRMVEQGTNARQE